MASKLVSKLTIFNLHHLISTASLLLSKLKLLFSHLLITFASMISILSHTRRHDISLYPSGRIDISARVVRLLQLASGDVIDFALDDKEMFLYVRHRAGTYSGRHRAVIYATSNHRGTMRCWCKALTNALNITQTLRCPCGDIITDTAGRQLLPIITKLNIPKT